MEAITRYIDDVARALRAADHGEIHKLVTLLEESFGTTRSVFLIGNGGSAANASHFAQDLSKGAVPDLEGKRFSVLSLADNISFMTAISNDIGYERVFELQLRQFAREGDILVAISASGNSPNIIRAADYAITAGLEVAGFTGFDGGRLMPMSAIRIHVPVDRIGVVEAAHAAIMHMIVDLLKKRLGC